MSTPTQSVNAWIFLGEDESAPSGGGSSLVATIPFPKTFEQIAARVFNRFRIKVPLECSLPLILEPRRFQ
jgi:hypothetical protein